MIQIPEYAEGLPNICGSEELVAEAQRVGRRRPVFGDRGYVDFERVNSAFCIALHMHQPLVPAGGPDIRTARIISNLEYMAQHPEVGDNRNAPGFRWCYRRMGEIIPQLVLAGHNPRIMLEYSGTLLHGLRQMGANDVIESLQTLTQNPEYSRCVEWLGCPWGHAVAPSTSAQDYRLHVRAWQNHFAAVFGLEALGRVRGFAPAEMALPSHPDVAYSYIKTLREAGYDWLLVQEHTVEVPETGLGPEQKNVPHRLICQSSSGEQVSIVVLIKGHTSDIKVVAQMQPYLEATELSRVKLAGRSIPPLVTQISDGENGGVMMNEFPQKYMEVVRRCSGTSTPMLNGTEYLEHLASLGVEETDFPSVQPASQKRIWDRMKPGDGPEKLSKVIETLKKENARIPVEGGSWTNELSWVRGYENVLLPTERVSAHFASVMAEVKPNSREHRYRNALFHLLCSQTSCYRYWGPGIWTAFCSEICRRAEDILTYDF